jgi:hypothetical protein
MDAPHLAWRLLAFDMRAKRVGITRQRIPAWARRKGRIDILGTRGFPASRLFHRRRGALPASSPMTRDLTKRHLTLLVGSRAFPAVIHQ